MLRRGMLKAEDGLYFGANSRDEGLDFDQTCVF